MEGSFFHTTLPPLGPVAYLSDLVITKDKMKQDDKKSAKTARKIASTEVSPATPAPADPAGSQCTAEGTSNLMVERYRELEAGCFVYGYPMVGPAPDMWVHKGARPGQGQAARGAGAAAEQAGSASAGECAAFMLAARKCCFLVERLGMGLRCGVARCLLFMRPCYHHDMCLQRGHAWCTGSCEAVALSSA